MNALHPFVAELAARRQLQVGEVYRDGPRYWAGQVIATDGRELFLKAVIQDDPWTNPSSGQTFHPSDLLRTELMVVRALQAHRAELPGHMLEVVGGGEKWLLREFSQGDSLAAGASPLLFDERFFGTPVWQAAVDLVVALQQLTPELSDRLEQTPDSDRRYLATRMQEVDLDNPTELLAPYRAAIVTYLSQRRELYDNAAITFAHGQLFPPHLLWRQQRLCLIDWENACLNNHLSDLTALWIRGFGRTQWQAMFFDHLVERGIIATQEDRQLWHMNVLLQSAGNLNYLYWSQIETAAEQTQAVASLRQQIKTVLAKA